MQRLLELFDSLKQFGDDENATKLIDREIRRTSEWADENTPEDLREPLENWESRSARKPQSTRSVFDDVDANEDV
jgi:hypothetical protein